MRADHYRKLAGLHRVGRVRIVQQRKVRLEPVAAGMALPVVEPAVAPVVEGEDAVARRGHVRAWMRFRPLGVVDQEAGRRLGRGHAVPAESGGPLARQVERGALAVDVLHHAVVVGEPEPRHRAAGQLIDRRPGQCEHHPREVLLGEGAIGIAPADQALTRLGGVPVQTVDSPAGEVSGGVLRGLDQHHVRRVVDDGVRQPVQEHVRLARLGRAHEDHRGVFQAGQDLLRLHQVGDSLVLPGSGVSARVVQEADLGGGLRHGVAFGRANALRSGRDHLLQGREVGVGIKHLAAPLPFPAQRWCSGFGTAAAARPWSCTASPSGRPTAP